MARHCRVFFRRYDTMAMTRQHRPRGLGLFLLVRAHDHRDCHLLPHLSRDWTVVRIVVINLEYDVSLALTLTLQDLSNAKISINQQH